jgi:hypothetical protein
LGCGDSFFDEVQYGSFGEAAMSRGFGLWIPQEAADRTIRVIDLMIRAIEIPREPQEFELPNDPKGRRAKRRREEEQRREKEPRTGCFQVRDTRPIGGRLSRLSGQPFSCASPDRWATEYRDEEDEELIIEAFGLTGPLFRCSVSTHVSGSDAERMLADIAAHLAEQTGGVIDFGTRLPAVVELPGRTLLIGAGIKGRGKKTILDAEAIRAWSQRADCWMSG